MRTLPLVGLVGLLSTTACVRMYSDGATVPSAPEPITMAGPPGGGIDPGYGYQAPGQPGYPAGYPDGSSGGYPEGYPPGTEAAPQSAAGTDATGDPGYGTDVDVMSTVTDAEIDQTLQPYGQWVEDVEYGRVWRPDPTVVGVNFTPYETNGSWVSTDHGWSFDCGWDWAWLAFHFGNWMMFDGHWGWVPDHHWSVANVEWRSGGGYVGWRPTGPRVRDHRDRPKLTVRDHRTPKESSWRFVAQPDLGKPNIKAHTHVNLADALSVTSTVAQPPSRHVGPSTVKAASLMRGRMTAFRGTNLTVRGNPRPYTPTGSTDQPSRTYQPPTGATSQPPTRTYQPPTRTYQPPTGSTYQPPTRTYQPPTGSTYQPPTRTYQPPAPSRSTYTPPTPSRSTYTAPSRSSSSSTPSRSSSSSSSSSGGSSYSAPSRSSSSSSSSSRSSSSSSSSGKSSSSSSSGRRR